MRKLLLGLAAAAGLHAAAAQSGGPIPTTSQWVTLQKAPGNSDFRLYRRYGFLDDADQPIPNVLILNCSTSKFLTHFTLDLPKSFPLRSFARGSWFPKLTARFKVDDGVSFTMEGEYSEGEFFFDDSPDQHDQFKRVLAARRLSIGFGDANDVISFRFDDALNAKLNELLQGGDPATTGKLTFYDTPTVETLCGI